MLTPTFTESLREYVVVLRPAEPFWHPNRGQDLTVVQLNVTYRFVTSTITESPELGGLTYDVSVWQWNRAIAYAEKADGFIAQIRWLHSSALERIPTWLPRLIEVHRPDHVNTATRT